jgi:hypothetical protein
VQAIKNSFSLIGKKKKPWKENCHFLGFYWTGM